MTTSSNIETLYALSNIRELDIAYNLEGEQVAFAYESKICRENVSEEEKYEDSIHEKIHKWICFL